MEAASQTAIEVMSSESQTTVTWFWQADKAIQTELKHVSVGVQTAIQSVSLASKKIKIILFLLAIAIPYGFRWLRTLRRRLVILTKLNL